MGRVVGENGMGRKVGRVPGYVHAGTNQYIGPTYSNKGKVPT